MVDVIKMQLAHHGFKKIIIRHHAGAEVSRYAFVNEAKVLSKSEHWAITEGASPILKNNIAYIKALLYRGRLLGQQDGKSM